MEDYGKLADSVIIATDPEGNNIVMTINLKDDTAKAEEVISEDGTESKTPDGYNDPEKVNRDLQYAPEDIVEADRTERYRGRDGKRHCNCTGSERSRDLMRHKCTA